MRLMNKDGEKMAQKIHKGIFGMYIICYDCHLKYKNNLCLSGGENIKMKYEMNRNEKQNVVFFFLKHMY